jgi:hypothetical protein
MSVRDSQAPTGTENVRNIKVSCNFVRNIVKRAGNPATRTLHVMTGCDRHNTGLAHNKPLQDY